MPNWIPMFGKKIGLDYSGMKKECSNCYGPHPKKYCKSERVGLENFVYGFSKKLSHVPAALYGKLAKFAFKSEPPKISQQLGETAPTTSTAEPPSTAPPSTKTISLKMLTTKTSTPKPVMQSTSHPTSTSMPTPMPKPKPVLASNATSLSTTTTNTGIERPKIKIALKRANGVDWVHADTLDQDLVSGTPVVNSVVDNVTSFLHGIRASFRQDNVIVTNPQQLSKGSANQK